MTQHYYPFGMMMPARQYTKTEGYRFGYNGKEKDDEVKGGSGNSLDFGARIQDPRLGRWLSVDPLAIKYPHLSPYNYVGNNPIRFIDPDGKKIVDSQGRIAAVIDKNGKIQFTKYATDDIKTVITAMNASKIGNQISKDLITAKHDITISIDKREEPLYVNSKGETSNEAQWGYSLRLGQTKNTADGKGGLLKSEITIFEGSVKEGQKTVNVVELKEEEIDLSTKTKEEIVGAIGVHEGTHATDKDSAKILGATEPEKKPKENEEKHYKEVKKKE